MQNTKQDAHTTGLERRVTGKEREDMRTLRILSLLAIVLARLGAEKVVIHDIQKQQKVNQHSKVSPFLSATLSAKLTGIDCKFLCFARFHDRTLLSRETTSNGLCSLCALHVLDLAGTFDKSIVETSLASFYDKIFHDQQLYDVKIISVSVVDDHIVRSIEPHEVAGPEFTTVISAEYTDQYAQRVSQEAFTSLLIETSENFQSHLMSYLKAADDVFFGNVQSMTLRDYRRTDSEVEEVGVKEISQNEVLGSMSNSTQHIASIVAIAVGGVVLALFGYGAAKFYRKEKELKAARLRSREMASLSHESSIKGHDPRDDYSFDPLGFESTGRSYKLPANIRGYDDFRETPIRLGIPEDEEIAFNSVWPESAPPTMLQQPEPLSARSTKVLRSHCFAPPGKIGVAIDVDKGQPFVHKIRKGSPLENMLKAGDKIMAIDEIDTSCLNSADVTQIMVKRMDRVRKITFLREE